MPKAKSNEEGAASEAAAASFLKSKGLQIIDQNFRCKMGEIDLIAREKDTLVFIEVRHRKSTRFGSPAETVNYHKQQKIIKTSLYYLQIHKLDAPCRFDIIESQKYFKSYRFNWIKSAFDAYF